MSHEPLVSVIIPTYKRSEFILRALKSVINQTYKNIEILIVDDNNGNNEHRIKTKLKLESYIKSGLVTYIEHNQNKGLSAARNTGIQESKGTYLAFLDDDDEWLNDKIRVQIDKFATLPEDYALVYGAFKQIDQNTGNQKIIVPKYKGDLSKILGLNYIGPPSMVLCKKHAILNIDCFDEMFKSREDIDMYFRLSKKYKVSFVDNVLMNYYVHTDTMSKIYSDKLVYLERFIEKYKTDLVIPKTRWSELHERLGELYALNGFNMKAINAFVISFLHRVSRPQVLGKLFISILGQKQYKKLRKFD
ncbi:glycosyltransferase family 2 protein [Pontibacter roseus]|uniref:glycosyltransferase family 2 protein n=1 Tax=Pontibacter roseus TaxID=336989 RepID=UPI00036A8F5D|nr:glycosyltransferase family 2 protein [Pontibacter roseus]